MVLLLTTILRRDPLLYSQITEKDFFFASDEEILQNLTNVVLTCCHIQMLRKEKQIKHPSVNLGVDKIGIVDKEKTSVEM